MAKRDRTYPMIQTPIAQNSQEEGYLGGQVLVAMPNMQDPRFARTVICLCAHSPEGAMVAPAAR